jgi:hypothetical protein
MKTKDGRLFFNNVKPGMNAAIRLRDINGLTLCIVLLDEKTSLQLWKGKLAGKEHIIISDAAITCNGDQLELTGRDNNMSVSVYPSLRLLSEEKHLLKGNQAGIFIRYQMRHPVSIPVKVTLSKVAEAGPLREIKNGRAKVAESPKDSAFSGAAAWKILIGNAGKYRDIFLKLNYTGDVARIYSDDKLLTDNFYNGKPFEIGLKRFSKELINKTLLLKILPMQKGAPVYLQDNAIPDFKGMKSIVSVAGVETYENYHIKLTAH